MFCSHMEECYEDTMTAVEEGSRSVHYTCKSADRSVAEEGKEGGALNQGSGYGDEGDEGDDLRTRNDTHNVGDENVTGKRKVKRSRK